MEKRVGTTMESLGGQYRSSSEALRGRIEALEALRGEGKQRGMDLELLNRRLIRLKTMYCDTLLMARFLESHGGNRGISSEFLGVHVSW